MASFMCEKSAVKHAHRLSMIVTYVIKVLQKGGTVTAANARQIIKIVEVLHKTGFLTSEFIKLVHVNTNSKYVWLL